MVELNNEFDKKVVLIVEDSPSVNRMLQYLFISRGYAVRSACNGIEAIEIVRQIGRLDVIILDLRMPVMDGFQFITGIRRMEKQRHIPIIVLTAMEGEEVREQSLALGAVDFVAKPFISSELIERVSEACRNRNDAEQSVGGVPDAAVRRAVKEEWH